MGIGQQPAVLGGLPKIGQHGAVHALILAEHHAVRGGAANHGGFAGEEIRGHGIVVHLRVRRFRPGILKVLLESLNYPGPDLIVQTHRVFRRLALVPHPPQHSFHAHQLRNGAALQGLHAGIVLVIVVDIAVDSQLLKTAAHIGKLCVISGQRDAVLLEQVQICDVTIHLGAHGQPPDRASRLPVVFQIAVIEGARHLSLAQVHQKIRQIFRIVQGKPAAGNDIRQSTPVVQVGIEVHRIVPHNKGKVDLRKLLRQPGRQGLGHGFIPQVHGDGHPCLLLFICGTAGGAKQHRQNRDQRNQSLFHRLESSDILSFLRNL